MTDTHETVIQCYLMFGLLISYTVCMSRNHQLIILYLFLGLRRKLLNMLYNDDEIQISPLINYFVGTNKLDIEDLVYIMEEKKRKKRVGRFLSVIKHRFDKATYEDLKYQIDQQNEDILQN